MRVSIVERDGCVDVRVRDDGIGFDTARSSAGFGLIGMRERLALVQGLLEISSEPGVRTEVHARIPVTAADRRSLLGSVRG